MNEFQSSPIVVGLVIVPNIGNEIYFLVEIGQLLRTNEPLVVSSLSLDNHFILGNRIMFMDHEHLKHAIHVVLNQSLAQLKNLAIHGDFHDPTIETSLGGSFYQSWNFSIVGADDVEHL
jgi:hypothetical protein